MTTEPLEHRTTEQLEMEAAVVRYVKNLVRDAMDPDDDLAMVALREIDYLIRKPELGVLTPEEIASLGES